MKLHLTFLLFYLVICLSCNPSHKPTNTKEMNKSNPVVYFEIPVNDMERAEAFYSSVFNFSFEKEMIDGYKMALFPFEEKSSGISGALAKGDVYKPTKEGVIIYFKTENMDNTLKKVLQHGGKILYPKKVDIKHDFAVAEFEDSEGNRIALHETMQHE